MIQCDKGKISTSGDELTLMAEYSVITKELNTLGIDRDHLEDAFNLAFMSLEELETEFSKKLDGLINKLLGNTSGL